jgi:hypothetical protein
MSRIPEPEPAVFQEPEPAPVPVQSEPTYEPEPVYNEPEPAYNEPEPAYNEPEQTYEPPPTDAAEEVTYNNQAAHQDVYESDAAHHNNYHQETVEPKSSQEYEAIAQEYAQDQPTEQYYDQSDRGCCARAIYDYQAEDDTEISFDPGDIICYIEQIDPGWWRGMNENHMNHVGLFPANYVELI